jgi:hypothetical protein
MIVARIIAFFFLIIAAIALGRDVIAVIDSGTLQFLTGTQVWYLIGPDGYQAAQRWGSANLSFLWSPVITTILALPAFVSTGVVGFVIFMLSRPRKRTRGGGGPRSNLHQVYG